MQFSRTNRAKQFLPFDALKGLQEALREKEIQYEDRKELSEETLVEILTKPNNAVIKQFQKSFEMDNIELSFSEKALFKIAKEAKARKIGARALRSIVEDILKEPMFEAPGEKTIHAVVIDDNLKVNYVCQTEIDDIEIQEEQ